MNWISLEEEEPEDFEHVILYHPRFMSQRDFMAVTIYQKEAAKEMGATHWMKKPAPPKVKNSNKISLRDK